MVSEENTTPNMTGQDQEDEIDPINDIVDYLVRCANITFKNSHVDKCEVRTSDRIRMASDLYKRSPTDFLMQFGKYLAPFHVQYFEKLQPIEDDKNYQECVAQLKRYHSDEIRHKRVRNRRYKALQKLQDEADYFSEKEMMYRNPLLYEQLVGQYLTDDEIRQRDGVDNENLTFLNMILETVDRNQMRETKNEQLLEEEDTELTEATYKENKSSDPDRPRTKKRWGDFEKPDTVPSFTPEVRKQTMISAPERNLLREEFLQEMYSSFIDGRDAEVDYHSIDNDEQYDDLKQVSQDAEDRYFDSELNDVETLEEHMMLVEEYGRKNSNASNNDDPLDEFMKHITIKHNV